MLEEEEEDVGGGGGRFIESYRCEGVSRPCAPRAHRLRNMSRSSEKITAESILSPLASALTGMTSCRWTERTQLMPVKLSRLRERVRESGRERERERET